MATVPNSSLPFLSASRLSALAPSELDALRSRTGLQLGGVELAPRLFAAIHLCDVHTQLAFVPRSWSQEHWLFEACIQDFIIKFPCLWRKSVYLELVGFAVAFSVAVQVILHVASFWPGFTTDKLGSSEVSFVPGVICPFSWAVMIRSHFYTSAI